MSESFAIDAELGEALQANEAQIAEQIAAAVCAQIEREFFERKSKGERPQALRDAHPKSHGCVEAEFRVNDDVRPELAQGVFVPGRSYRAWIRFSNGSPKSKQPDATRDVRGMAIKLLDVPGDKILAEERDARTQDFVLMSSPRFFMDDAARYLEVSRVIASGGGRFKTFWALGAKSSFIAWKASPKIASPLETPYWSAVPYRLGEGPRKQAVKYLACPQPEPVRRAVPRDAAPNFLRETMAKQLAAGEARFDFKVQARAPDMSVENTMTEWEADEKNAPFRKVATITIPRQQFDTPERNDLGENLSFTPWHALPAHRPLGAVNRIRRVVYQATSKKRHDLNTAPRAEPGT